MEPVELSAIVEHLGARWHGGAGDPRPPAHALVAEVSTDSRNLKGRPIFIALRGENFDGHRFVPEARRRGAVACVVAETDLPHLPSDGGPYLVVDDPLVGMERLAKWNRDRIQPRVVAVTGSVGKTSTKEFLGTILSERFQTTVAPKSYNNRIGVATTLLAAGRDTEVLVTELGTSGPGEISHLSRIVRPDSIVVTEIAPTHLQGLRDLEGVLEAKAEIFDGLDATGRAYLRAGLFGYDQLADRAPGRVRTFGWGAGDYAITDCQRVSLGDSRSTSGSKAYGYHFTLNDKENLLVPVPGKHNVVNATAAISVAHDMGMSFSEIRSGMAICRLPPLRLEVVEVRGILFVNDSYNASPRSMQAAIEEWEELGTSETIRGRWNGSEAYVAAQNGNGVDANDGTSHGEDSECGGIAVLGDMLELGDESCQLHEELGRRLTRTTLRLLVTIGQDSACIGGGYRCAGGAAESVHFENAVEAIPFLRSSLRRGDHVLLKGSRKTGLDRVCKDLHRWVNVHGEIHSGGASSESLDARLSLNSRGNRQRHNA